jgi:LruC domain-containing protein
MKERIFLSLLLLVLVFSCNMDVEDNQNDQSDPSIEDITQLNIPANFDFNTTSEIEMGIVVKSIADVALPGVKVSFFTSHPDFGGKLISNAFTNSLGVLQTKIEVSSYLDEVFVQVHSVGFANQKTVSVEPQINIEFGGIPETRPSNRTFNTNSDAIPISGNYYYMGNFNTGSWKGLPHYLESESDQLSQTFLDDVNASLPEGKPVPNYNPEYLTTGNELDVVVNELSDVWVTFVTEGAGYRNALGYYVFDTDNPPSNVSEIDSIHVVLPNASLAYSGGELYAGDKIRLGTFEGGKTISWVLFQNAWTGSGVNVNATKFYSRLDFNTSESNPNMRQHTVQLMDIGRQRLLNAFEDLLRSGGGSDDDFNDLVFYVSANPWEAIETGGMLQVRPNVDADGDGVSDESDDFPNDPLRAVRNTYEGSLAYEDLWPSKGDYDFNDLVIDYEVDHILDGNNLLVDIEADWTIKAVGAGFRNGFGIELDGLSSNDIASISGQDLQEGIVSNNGNGTEASQSSASIIIFDNVLNQIQSAGGEFINTVPSNPYTTPVTLSTVINLSNPMSQDIVGLPPYDPFIFVNGNRGKEIHLPGQDPTDLADVNWFNTSADATNPSSNYYYKTANGLPWAINVSESFEYPIESTPINRAYLDFAIWASSGGSVKKDWYLDLSSNRATDKIY